MVLVQGRELRNRRHAPVEAPQVVAVAVAEPEGVVRTHAAARDAAVAGREVRGVVERAHGELARSLVAGACIEERVRRRPA